MKNNQYYVMLHDEKRCIGCQACSVACKTVNAVHTDFSRVQVHIKGPVQSAKKPFFEFFRVSCQHCEDAPCISVCPTNASYRDENGVVRIDQEKCLGCDYCVAACPYHVRYINPATHCADKCDFCSDTRLSQGEQPACVSVCPTNALMFGRADDPVIKAWIQNRDVYTYALEGARKPHLYRRKETQSGGL